MYFFTAKAFDPNAQYHLMTKKLLVLLLVDQINTSCDAGLIFHSISVQNLCR